MRPILFYLPFGIPLYAYGLMLTVSVIAGRLLAWADCVAPSLCVGLALTRVGCFLGGCDFGRDWNGPWAVGFPAGSPAFVQQARLGLLPSGAALVYTLRRRRVAFSDPAPIL